tara:strand:- start:992 stop:1720 length:729 start_codon:yes stop_codon:yes gene_type:complete
LARTLEVEDRLRLFADRVGYCFEDPSLLQLAMSHRSWCAERGNSPSNERLELLGDAVLGYCVTSHLYRVHPDWNEGDLAQARSSVVNSSSLAEVAQRYDLGSALLLGVGEERSGGRGKESLLCDAFEALLGAIYLDGGMEPAEAFVLEALKQRMTQVADDPGVDDAKTRLQEFVVRSYGDSPNYVVTDSGPDHNKSFHSQVWFGGSVQGEGQGTSKKQAEQAAAAHAWQTLKATAEPDRSTT